MDTGPLFAALHAGDRDHVVCAQLFDTDEQVVVPAPVVVEAEWLVVSRLGEEAFDAIYEDIGSGALKVHNLSMADWQRVRQLCGVYVDLPLGLVDASVIVTAERLNEDKVATLDRRHFSIVRPRHVEALTLLPAYLTKNRSSPA